MLFSLLLFLSEVVQGIILSFWLYFLFLMIDIDLYCLAIQAVSTLLRFDKEEEKLVTDHLNYKVSWFGSKPSLKKLKSAKVRDVL